MSDGLALLVAVAGFAAAFWLGWSLCISYHRHKRRRRPRPVHLPVAVPPPTVRPSRPADSPSLASTYQDGGTHKRSLVGRQVKELDTE